MSPRCVISACSSVSCSISTRLAADRAERPHLRRDVRRRADADRRLERSPLNPIVIK
jgi:hypothetical protein